MKYIFTAVLSVMLLMLSGCLNPEHEDTYLPLESQETNYIPKEYEFSYEDVAYNPVTHEFPYENVAYSPAAYESLTPDNTGIYVLSEHSFMEQLTEIKFNVENFLGSTIRYDGKFYSYYLEYELIFFAGVEGRGCCGMGFHGLEIYLNDIPRVPEYTRVEVTGVLEKLYDVNFGYFLRLNLISMNTINRPQRITPQEAEIMMVGEHFIILDVRTQAEFAAGHIENAVLLPLNEIAERAEAVIPNKNYNLLIYCQSGNRSNQAAWLLSEMGYTSVYDFGGIFSWHGEIVGDSNW